MSALHTKKTIGFGMIPPKLVEMVANASFLNKSLSKGLFPDDAKIALIVSLDEGTSKKKDISNFRRAIFLTKFSKSY